MKEVIITGATSMMGIALLKECIQNNTYAVAVIRSNSKNANRLPESEFVNVVECDLDNIDRLPNILEKKEYGAFYHFAWDGTSKQLRDDVFIHEKNVCKSLCAVKSAKVLGCDAFIGAGSQAEYGRVSNVIYPNTPTNPEFAYGISKLAAGKLCANYCDQVGMRSVWGRIFSVYGEYDNSNTMIMYLIKSLLNGDSPQLTKCEQMWDYMYCADAAKAFYAMGTRGQGTYCVGSGKMRKLSEYAYIIKDIINKDIKLQIGKKEYAKNQVMCLCANIDSLASDTGFIAEFDFEAGIRKTIKWYIEKVYDEKK